MLAASQVKSPAAKWAFVFWWTFANLIGFSLAGALFHNFPLAFSPAHLTPLGSFNLTAAILGGLLFGAIPALVIGWPQRALLRRYWTLSRWWILTTSLGMAVMHFLSDGFENARDLSVAVLLGGLTAGVFQRLLLRPHLSSGWWIPASVTGWTLGWMISLAVLSAIGIRNIPWVPGLEVRQHGILGLSAGLTSGLTTGLLVIWLLRADAPIAAVEKTPGSVLP